MAATAGATSAPNPAPAVPIGMRAAGTDSAFANRFHTNTRHRGGTGALGAATTGVPSGVPAGRGGGATVSDGTALSS